MKINFNYKDNLVKIENASEKTIHLNGKYISANEAEKAAKSKIEEITNILSTAKHYYDLADLKEYARGMNDTFILKDTDPLNFIGKRLKVVLKK